MNKTNETNGLEALERLFVIAHGYKIESRNVAAFLLGLYSSDRFPFSLTDFRSLDRAIFDDCMTVLKADYITNQKIHSYFMDKCTRLEQLALDWNIDDYSFLNNDRF